MSIAELLISVAEKVKSIKESVSVALEMIANKGGSYVGDNMSAVIDGIDSLIGSNELQDKEAIIPLGEQTIVADEGYKGLNSVLVTAVDEVYGADASNSHGGSHKMTKGYIESAVTNTSGHLAVGASGSNKMVINGDLHLDYFTSQTARTGFLFRFVHIKGSLYLPNCETLNNNMNASGNDAYGGILSYAIVYGDIHISKLKTGSIGFSAQSGFTGTLYLGSHSKGGAIAMAYYGDASIGNIVIEEGFGNSLYLTHKNGAFSKSHDQLMHIINNVYDFATDPLDGFTPTLSFGAVNLDKLSDEEKAIATAKGWTLA